MWGKREPIRLASIERPNDGLDAPVTVHSDGSQGR
jgi:hypothetical protein